MKKRCKRNIFTYFAYLHTIIPARFNLLTQSDLERDVIEKKLSSLTIPWTISETIQRAFQWAPKPTLIFFIFRSSSFSCLFLPVIFSKLRFRNPDFLGVTRCSSIEVHLRFGAYILHPAGLLRDLLHGVTWLLRSHDSENLKSTKSKFAKPTWVCLLKCQCIRSTAISLLMICSIFIFW